MYEEVYKENSYSYCIPSICSDCENKQKVIESGYMCLLCKKCKEILKHTMEHEEDEYISGENVNIEEEVIMTDPEILPC